MEWIKKIPPIKVLIIVGIFALLVAAALIATQSYFTYLEVTEASNRCYDIGGVPVIEKSALRMTSFQCNVE